MTEIVEISGRDAEARWDGFVREAAAAQPYHLSAWRHVFEDSFGQETHYLQASLDDAVTGVLPLVRVRSPIFGDFLVSMPHLNYGGPCAGDPLTARALVDRAVQVARDLRVDHLELRSERDADSGLRSRAAKVSMRLPLPASSEDLWNSFPTKLRTKIRRAQQEAFEFRAGGIDVLDAFYDVFVENMRDLGTPVYGKNFFRTVLERLAGNAWIGIIYLGGEPVAGGFLIGFRSTVEIPWGSSLKKYNRLNPNIVLYWELLRLSCEKGFRTFDFGRSTPDSGPYHFKIQWGACPTPLAWQYWVRNDGPLPGLNPQNPRYELAVRAWKLLPLPLTRWLGPHIVKHIP